jgi:hypothetical protein
MTTSRRGDRCVWLGCLPGLAIAAHVCCLLVPPQNTHTQKIASGEEKAKNKKGKMLDSVDEEKPSETTTMTMGGSPCSSTLFDPSRPLTLDDLLFSWL